jgi:DnaJ-class molecular chaperone
MCSSTSTRKLMMDLRCTGKSLLKLSSKIQREESEMTKPRYPNARINKNLPPNVPPNKPNLLPPSYISRGKSLFRPPQKTTTRNIIFGKCDACNGSGYDGWFKLFQCKSCNGTGRFEKTCRILRIAKCPICNGSGHEGWLKISKCKSCRGIGRVDIVECNLCNGTESDCPACHGLGEFWVSATPNRL